MILTLPQGIVGCGVSFVLVTWCIEKRGAVFVAAFIPVVQIIVSVIDFSILHEQLYLGRYVRTLMVPCHAITEYLNPIHLIESEVTCSALLLRCPLCMQCAGISASDRWPVSSAVGQEAGGPALSSSSKGCRRRRC